MCRQQRLAAVAGTTIMPTTAFAPSFTGLPLTAPLPQGPLQGPLRQGPLPPPAAAGKVGADAAVLAGVACRITADKATKPIGRLGKTECVLYPFWGLLAAALTGVRGAQLPAMLRDVPSAGILATCSFRIGIAMPVLAALEAGVAIARFVKVVRKRGRLDARLRDTAADHTRCEAALRQRLASRTEAALPAERAVRRQQRQALRDDGSLDAFLLYRHSRAERGDNDGKLFSSGLTLARDAVVQGVAASSGVLQVLSRMLPTVAAALPWTGIAGCAASVAMSTAQIVTGVMQWRDSARQRAALHQRREVLRRSPLAAALDGLERHGAAATVCKAQPLSPRRQRIVGEADPAQLRQTADFYRTVMQYCDSQIGEAIESANKDVRKAGLRIAYGAGTLGVNGAVLGLTVAALTTVTAATAGTGLMVVGGVLGLCWLGFAVYRMVKWVKSRRALRDAALTARQVLTPAAGNDAAASKAIAAACAQLDAGNAADHRHLIAARVMQHLQARGSAQALAERSLARALMRTLGADAEVVAAIESAQTPEQCRLAIKLVLRHLDGRCIDPGREQEAVSTRDADGASEPPGKAPDDAQRDVQSDVRDDRVPLLHRMAATASAS